jgi:hypothetical protein
MKLTNKIYVIIIGILIAVILFICFAPKVESRIQEQQEQKRLSWLLEEINNLYILNEDYTKQRNELEKQQTQLHNSAEENRTQIAKLRNEYYKGTWDDVMKTICELSPSSPMCNNYRMLDSLKKIANERWVDYKLLLWIMYAESKLGTARAPTEDCKGSNNWWWVKARKYDDGSVSEWFDKQESKIPWCWLYNFETVEDFFESLANTISLWYAKCNWDVYCISRSYVGHESWAWVNNVYKFLSIN